jgi:p-hydroxybenzoate 3-monooxygenase
MPGADPMEEQLALSQLRYVTSSRAAAASLAENYTGLAIQLAGTGHAN